MAHLRKIIVPSLAIAVIGAMLVTISLKGIAYIARNKASEIVFPLIETDPQTTVLNIAQWTTDNFYHSTDINPWYYRYDFILSHRFMPSFIRLPVGAVEILSGGGACNDIGSILELLYSSAGFQADQHDVVAPGNGHSGTSVLVGEKWVWVDGYFGVMFQENGQLLSLDRLKILISSGRSPSEFLIPLSPNPKLWFYDRLPQAVHGRQDQAIVSYITIPFVAGKFEMGKIDQSNLDVAEEAGIRLLNPHLNYLGPRYGRNFEFKFIAENNLAPEGFKITFHVTEMVDKDNLPASNAPALVGRKTISYTATDSTEGVHLIYRGMQWTFRDILRRKSWYDVDMISASVILTSVEASSD